MTKKIEVGVIGLGKFGGALAEALGELEHHVVGIDADMDRVRHAQNLLTHVYQAEATDKGALEELGVTELDYVVVSVGSFMGPSILVAMNLLELGVENIWVKAMSEEHVRVLKRLGVPNVIFPEQHVARQLAHQLAVPGLLEYLPLGSGIALRETEVDKWAGTSLRELSLPSSMGAQIVAVKKAETAGYDFVPKADNVLSEGDVLVLLGPADKISEIEA